MKRRVIVSVLLVVGIAILGLAWWMREPVVNGQPLGYWIDARRYRPGETFASVGAAYKEMDGRSVRWLARQLSWQPSRFRQMAAKRLNVIVDGLISEQTPGDCRIFAANALGNLGERAMPAVAALEKAAQTTVEPEAWHVRSIAKTSLIRLGRRSMQQHIDALNDISNAAKWHEEIYTLEALGTNAAPAIPTVVAFIQSTNEVRLRVRAIGFLGGVASNPDVSVPALQRALKDPLTRGVAVNALGRFRSAASNATDAVVACLKDTDPKVQVIALAALRAINPEKAKAIEGISSR